MNYISIIIAHLMELLTEIVFANRLFEKRMSYPKIITFGVCLYAAQYVSFVYLSNYYANVAISFLVYFVFLLVCYKDKVKNFAFYTVILLLFMNAGEMIVSYWHLGNMNVPLIEQSNEIVLLAMVLSSKTIYFVLAQIFASIIAKSEKRLSNKKFVPLLLFPVFSIVLEMVLAYVAEIYNVSKTIAIIFAVGGGVFVILSMLIFVYYQQLDENEGKLRELEREQQFVKLNDSYMKVLEHQNNEMRMIVHDTKNHYNAIANMDDTAEIKEYIDSIFDDIEKYQIIKLTNNRMLDLLLSKYKVICNDKRITLDLEVKTANLDYIDNTDLSIIVSNLMDNAISACEKSKERYINLCIRKVNSFDVLTVSNTCDEKPNISGKRIITSKSDKQSHGHGMKIISKYAKKNNAEYEWYYDETEHTFCSTLMFNR